LNARISSSNNSYTNEPIRVLFILAHLEGAGAERTVINLLKNIDSERFHCRIALLNNQGAYLDYATKQGWIEKLPLAPKFIRNWSLNDPRRILFSAWQIRKVILRYKPHIVMTFFGQTTIPTYFSRVRHITGLRWIAREGSNIPLSVSDLFPNKFMAYCVNRLIGITLHKANMTLGVSASLTNNMIETFHLLPARTQTIHNPVDLEQIRNADINQNKEFSQQHKNSIMDPRPMILTAGRLRYQKGHDILIKAFAKTLASHGFQLTILGEGEERNKLQGIINDLDLQDKVYLPGYTNNPWQWMHKAKCFVLPSRWEGFGHVIVEAMACGTPVIATDCDHGPAEILEQGLSGLLIPADSQEQLENALISINNDNDTSRQARTKRARHRAEDFSDAKITRQYENLFDHVLQSSI
jgi:glycosyltransferase involved in cell wall biosynthesis